MTVIQVPSEMPPGKTVTHTLHEDSIAKRHTVKSTNGPNYRHENLKNPKNLEKFSRILARSKNQDARRDSGKAANRKAETGKFPT